MILIKYILLLSDDVLKKNTIYKRGVLWNVMIWKKTAQRSLLAR